MVFLLPLVLTWLLLAKAFDLMLRIMRPIENVLPHWTVLGVTMPHLVAGMLIFLACLLAGLLATTAPGQKLARWLDQLAINRLPGYVMVRTLFMDMIPTNQPVEVALVEMENMHVVAFVMERHGNGYVTIFVPSAPTPAVGSVFVARDDQVRVIDSSLKDAMMCISRLGLGVGRLLERSRGRAADNDPRTSASR